MAGHNTYEDGIRLVYRGLMILGLVTIFEVIVALLAKGHLVESINFTHGIGHWFYMLVMIGCSLYKAYFIIYEFMHMRYEAKGLSMSVLLPTLLLVWAIIAFFSEGNYWKNSRQDQQRKYEQTTQPVAKPKG